MTTTSRALLFLFSLCCFVDQSLGFLQHSSWFRGDFTRNDKFTRKYPPSSRHDLKMLAAIKPGDTVVVIGGTGGVGQLVTKKLQSRGNCKVRVTSRSKAKGEEIVDDSSVGVFEVDLVAGSDEQLNAALKGASAVVISVGTTAFPTIKWKGGNTPEAIDKIAVSRIATAASNIPSIKKVVLLTSVGVDRTKQMPFVILNLFGVLDAKRSGEEAVINASKKAGFDYVVVRPGRLVGGPYTNLDFARLLKLQGGAENGVDIDLGDSLLGDCKRDACAEAVVQCLTNDACKDLTLSIVSSEDPALTNKMWTSLFQTLMKKNTGT